jgi:hypothetical protein
MFPLYVHSTVIYIPTYIIIIYIYIDTSAPGRGQNKNPRVPLENSVLGLSQ